jgi:hypothetical protein
VFRVALAAFHGRIDIEKDSVKRDGVGHLLADINVADQTAIRHSLVLPKGGMALPAFVPDLCMRQDSTDFYPRHAVQFSWAEHGTTAGNSHTGYDQRGDESADDGGSRETTQAIIHKIF